MNNKEELSILYISPLPPPYGGIASWTKTVMNWAEKNKKKIEIVDTSKSKSEKVSPGSSIGVFLQLFRTLSILKDLISKLNKNNVDLIHINSGPSLLGLLRDYICIKIIQRYNLKVIIQFHYDIQSFGNSNEIYKKLLSKVVSVVDSAWVLNESSLEAISKKIPTPTNKIIPNFIEGDIIKSNKAVSENLKDIGYLGAIKKTKGIDEILKVAKKLPNLNFHLIGPIEDESYLEQATNNISFYGALEHSLAIDKLSEMDLFLFLSHTEGSSIAIFEAMSQGLPIITTAVGANLMVLKETDNYLVNKDNIQEISSIIKKLNNSENREKIGDKNIKIIKENYISEVVISNIFKEYEKLLNVSQ